MQSIAKCVTSGKVPLIVDSASIFERLEKKVLFLASKQQFVWMLKLEGVIRNKNGLIIRPLSAETIFHSTKM